jgi:AcrR family transcriptional regulator
MHSMAESATVRGDRRSGTTQRITQAARRLTDERGLDGFTMDELAATAEVSRRTLFNHFAGKVDAVLGPLPEIPAEVLATFRGGGPRGDLVLDLCVLADATLEARDVEREELAMVRRLLRASPKLLAATHDRFVKLSEQLVEEIELREGPEFGRLRARVAIGVLASLFDTSLQAFLDDPGLGTLAHHFDDSIRFARELFR